MRPITGEELAGFREAMIELAVYIDITDLDAIDMCGTGGDGKDTFNISTLAAFVVAGAGYKVAKHGNYGVSSSCGSSIITRSNLVHLAFCHELKLSRYEPFNISSSLCLHLKSFTSLGSSEFLGCMFPNTPINKSFTSNSLLILPSVFSQSPFQAIYNIAVFGKYNTCHNIKNHVIVVFACCLATIKFISKSVCFV